MMDADLVLEFVEEAREHLADVEMQLLQIEAMGEDINDDLVNTVFRAIHSVKGAAGFLGLTQINNVSHRLENVLGRVRDHQLIPNPFNVDVMLKAADRVRNLIEEVDSSNETDNAELCAKLDELLAEKDGGDAVAETEKHLETAESAVAAASQGLDNDESSDSESPTTESAATDSSDTDSPAPQASNDSGDDSEGSQEAAPESASETPVASAESNAEESNPAPEAKAAPEAKPVAETAVAAPPKAPSAASKSAAPADATIRVSVRVLDRLMNLAGELVLSRNQLLRVLGEQTRNSSNLDSIAGGLDQVTTELQETIMQTRMQPIGNVFNKFPRVIRDLSSTLGKNISLKMEGTEVETDKTIVEAIADPLTHLVRNSCDHGIEDPNTRTAAGKPPGGNVFLRAFHQAGKVVIEIVDDGAGMDPAKLRTKAIDKGVITAEAASQMDDRDAVNLIFAPGFSTAEAVTDVSGRGVGMDVVRTNIEKLGGAVEVESKLGKGSTIRITLPLTLAIVPAMIVSADGTPYALPQSNIVELVQTGGSEKRVERVSNAEVLRLRGSLLPLVRLRAALGLPIMDEEGLDATKEQQLVVVEAGRNRFAVAVDRVLDSEEIVVKPLGRHLSSLPLLAGSTILGDGRVAMILDAAGIANQTEMSTDGESRADVEISESTEAEQGDMQRLVLLSVSDSDHFAVSMDVVSRIERVKADAIDWVGERRALQYRGGTLPLLGLEEAISVSEIEETDFIHIVVFKVYGQEAGLIAPRLDDIRDCDISKSTDTCGQPGVAGVAVIEERTTRILDLYGISEIARPEWFERKMGEHGHDDEEPRDLRILVAEDSPFFRNFLVNTLVGEGYKVTAAEDGEECWSVLCDTPNDFDLLMTDIEMPELDGFGLTRRVREDGRFGSLPIIALSSLADDASVQKGLDVGVNDYQVKMNKPELLASILKLTAACTSR
ncbi:MAG: chemotaxis protein CheW [Planctomycetota bacterium]